MLLALAAAVVVTAESDPVLSCPISVTLGYLKGVLPDGVAAAWVGAVVKRAAELYIKRLLLLAAQQEREEEDEGVCVYLCVCIWGRLGAEPPPLPASPALAALQRN